MNKEILQIDPLSLSPVYLNLRWVVVPRPGSDKDGVLPDALLSREQHLWGMQDFWMGTAIMERRFKSDTKRGAGAVTDVTSHK